MRYLSLAFLGGFYVTLNGTSIDSFGSDKTRALLAYLAIENQRPHRRDTLAAIFWPDLSEKKAAHNLSQTLLRLRTALEDTKLETSSSTQPFLLVNGQQLSLNPQSNIHSDAVTFRNLFKNCQQHHNKDLSAAANCPDCLVWMREAAELYGGDFLAGFFVHDSPVFEQWRLVQQEAFQIQAVNMLEQLANHHERHGEYEQVQYYAHRLTTLDPWCEDAHLQLMRALAARGQMAAALDHYETYRRALSEELGIEPSLATTHLYQQIRLGELLPSHEPHPSSENLAAASQPELRQITTLVCGRCSPQTQDDPEQQYLTMRACRTTCARVLTRYGGFFAQRQGSDCLVHYGYPLAYEDSACRAVLAGLAMVANNTADPVRVSIHTSQMVIGEKRGRRAQDRELVGDAPDLAREFLKQAAPGNVVISADTERLVRGWFRCQPSGSFPADAGAAPLYHLTGPGGLPDPFDRLAESSELSPFVGREHEMGQLGACLRKVYEGIGQLVIIRGEPGIGKSRLIWEVKRTSLQRSESASSTPLWGMVRCTQYDQNISLYPLVSLAEQLLGVRPDDSLEDRNRKIADGLAREFPRQPAPARLMTMMLDTPYTQPSPQPTMQLRELMQIAFVRFIQQRAAQHPLALVIEDIQWSDTDTITWLSRASEMLRDTPCLVVLTARNNFDPPWLAQQSAARLDLAPFPETQAEMLVRATAGNTSIPARLMDDIISRADGIPLFLEHLTRDLPRTQPLDAAAQPRIPAGLRDVLTARLDNLGPVKAMAQWAAMIGRTFSYTTLLAASGVEPVRMQKDLAVMQSAGIIYPLDTLLYGDYAFRYALIQETARASLLKTAREEYQRRIDAVQVRVA